MKWASLTLTRIILGWNSIHPRIKIPRCSKCPAEVLNSCSTVTMACSPEGTFKASVEVRFLCNLKTFERGDGESDSEQRNQWFNQQHFSTPAPAAIKTSRPWKSARTARNSISRGTLFSAETAREIIETQKKGVLSSSVRPSRWLYWKTILKNYIQAMKSPRENMYKETDEFQSWGHSMACK